MKILINRSVCTLSLISLSLVGFQGSAVASGRGNISDATGGNVSDIEGINVSDIKGGNVSDIEGANTSNSVSPIDQQSANQLAADLATAYEACVGGGDCTAFYSLFDIANSSGL